MKILEEDGLAHQVRSIIAPANDAIIEPNLINSLGENPDDEESVPLANNNKLPRFHARAMAKDVGDANLPDDQDTENDHDGEDDRGEK